MELTNKKKDRRTNHRFSIQRELRYRMTEAGVQTATGLGATVNMGSCGVAFKTDQPMHIGAFVELSISWPVLLDDVLPIRLIVFGRVLRVSGHHAACSLDKYEFRTQGRTLHAAASVVRSDSMLERWADGVRKGGVKPHLAGA